MNVFDYILIAIIGAGVYFALRYIIKRKKKGKCIGCSGCDGCPHADKCGGKKDKVK